MTNIQVIRSFLRGEEAKTPLRDIKNDYYEFKGCTLRSLVNDSDYDIILYIYDTAIAKIKNNNLYLNIHKYSKTTSKIQNLIKRIASEYNYIIYEYDSHK